MSDIDTAAVDSLKVLDPKRPIREADITQNCIHVRWQRNFGMLRAPVERVQMGFKRALLGPTFLASGLIVFRSSYRWISNRLEHALNAHRQLRGNTYGLHRHDETSLKPRRARAPGGSLECGTKSGRKTEMLNKEEKWVAPKPSRDERVEAIRRFTKRKERACPHKPCFGCSMRSLCPVVQMFFWPDLVARA